MLLKVFTLEFNNSLGKFDDQEVQNFLISKNLVSMKDYVIEKNGDPYLVLVITYTVSDKDIKVISKENDNSSPKVKDESWKELINKSNEAIFNSLRSWRYERSKKDGVPSYIVFTNKQLAEIVSKNPTSLNQLSQVDGIGPGKIQKYGTQVLDLLSGKGQEVEAPSA